VLVGAGFALLARVDGSGNYPTEVFPAVGVFGLGLAVTVAPLTATVLAAAPARHAGIASAVNNDVARAAGLIAVAVLPAAAGITGAAYLDPAEFSAGFRTASFISAGLCVLGGALAAATVVNPRPTVPAVEAVPEPSNRSIRCTARWTARRCRTCAAPSADPFAGAPGSGRVGSARGAG
jgi:hypothetical protein